MAPTATLHDGVWKWEIRLGPDNRLRVFYEIDHVHRAVQILAIGMKRRNRLYIGQEEIAL